MPITDHPSFDRPPISTGLWRYMDLPKFVELITSGSLWLTNAEVLAQDDPYEGSPGLLQFPHRLWTSMEQVPDQLGRQIIEIYGRGENNSPEAAFRSWFMVEEQRCIMTQSGRRNFYINCWHAAEHESVAMWKIYGAPGAGVAVVSNGGRLGTALTESEEELHLGAVTYQSPARFKIGVPNAFDPIMIKSSSYSYESEVRLVYWQTADSHDPLSNFAWNEERLRFDDIVEDVRPVPSGRSFSCDVSVMIKELIVSPFAPLWYAPMIIRLRDRLGYAFPVHQSKLLQQPHIMP